VNVNLSNDASQVGGADRQQSIRPPNTSNDSGCINGDRNDDDDDGGGISRAVVGVPNAEDVDNEDCAPRRISGGRISSPLDEKTSWSVCRSSLLHDDSPS